MAITTTKSRLSQGLAGRSTFILVMIPVCIAVRQFLATEAGRTLFETLAFSVGSLQGAAAVYSASLQLMQDMATTAIVLASCAGW